MRDVGWDRKVRDGKMKMLRSGVHTLVSNLPIVTTSAARSQFGTCIASQYNKRRRCVLF